jgi:hypothetical protein
MQDLLVEVGGFGLVVVIVGCCVVGWGTDVSASEKVALIPNYQAARLLYNVYLLPASSKVATRMY